MARFNVCYGSLRPQCPAPIVSVSSGGSITASFYLALIACNRVGLNQASSLVGVAANNQQITITLPTWTDAEDPHRVIVAASATNNPSALQPLCWWRGYDWNSTGDGFYQEVRRSTSPQPTLTLTLPQHVAMGAVVPDPATLTSMGNLLDGMVRWVTSLANQFYYDPTSSATVDGVTVISAGTSPGRWVLWPFPSTLGVGSITDITGQYGCSRDMRSLADSDVLFPPPRYKMDGVRSNPVIYWVANGYDETSDAIPAGTLLAMDVYQSGLPKSQLFTRRVSNQLIGYIRESTGALTTTGLTTGVYNDFVYGSPIYNLESDLNSGYAAAFRTALRFRAEELGGNIALGTLAIKFSVMAQSGSFVPGGTFFGDMIYKLGLLRRVFPKRGANVHVGDGSGIVYRFEFPSRPATDIILGTTAVTNAKISINSNGDVFYRGTNALDPTELLRAVITMGSGRSNPSPASAYTAIAANGSLKVTITYPTAIRSDYPDVIAGASTSIADFNPPYVVLYVQRQSDGQIREFASNATVTGTTQTFTMTSFTGGTQIASIPSNASGDFSFWSSQSTPALQVVSSGGTFAADNYRVYWAVRYDGTTVSDISHSTANGCIAEATGGINDIFIQLSALQATLTALQSRLTTDESSITALQSRATTDEASITALQSRATTDESNISTLQSGQTSLQTSVTSLQTSQNSYFSPAGQLTASQVNVSGQVLKLNSASISSGSDWPYTVERPTSGQTASARLILPTQPSSANARPGQLLTRASSTISDYNLLNLEFSNGMPLLYARQRVSESGSFSTSTLTLATLPGACEVLFVEVLLVTAFNSGATISVGVSGDTARYLPPGFVNLAMVKPPLSAYAYDKPVFVFRPSYDIGSSPSTSGQTLLITLLGAGGTGVALVRVGYIQVA